MRTLPVVLACSLALTAPALADPLPVQSARVVDYHISVTLDPQTRQLKGVERVTWRNPSTEAVPDLWFHL